MARDKTFGKIKVRHEEASDDNCIILTFTDRRVYDDTRRALMKTVGSKIVDEFFGYKVFTNVDDAMGLIRAFCRKPL